MTFLALALACAVAWAGQEPSEQNPSALPVSIDRIKERLNRPAVLQLPAERKADFRATVTEEFTPPETVLEALRRELGGDVTPKRIPPGTISPPLVSVDLLQFVTHMKRQIGGALRARAERNARDEVTEVLAEFCAEHDCSVVEQSLPRRSDSEGGKQSLPEGILTH
jgi:hypothetical protein